MKYCLSEKTINIYTLIQYVFQVQMWGKKLHDFWPFQLIYINRINQSNQKPPQHILVLH